MKPRTVDRETYVQFTDNDSPCPQCGEQGVRHSYGSRRIATLGSPGVSAYLRVTYSKFQCGKCVKFYSHEGMAELAAPSKRYTYEVQRMALEQYASGLSYAQVRRDMLDDYGVYIPTATLSTWWKETSATMTKKMLNTVYSNRKARKKGNRIIPFEAKDLCPIELFPIMGE